MVGCVVDIRVEQSAVLARLWLKPSLDGCTDPEPKKLHFAPIAFAARIKRLHKKHDPQANQLRPLNLAPLGGFTPAISELSTGSSVSGATVNEFSFRCSHSSSPFD